MTDHTNNTSPQRPSDETGTEADRAHVLLKATLDILQKADRGPYVEDVFGLTAHWDGAECDGRCLMEDIADYLEYGEISLPPTHRLGASGSCATASGEAVSEVNIKSSPDTGELIERLENAATRAERYFSPEFASFIRDAAGALSHQDQRIKDLERTIETLERNSRTQAKLLADTGRRAEAAEARLASSHTPEVARVKHRNGSTYIIVGAALAQTTDGISDYDGLVIYCSEEDGSLWVRPASEFWDGRFERISSHAPEQEGQTAPPQHGGEDA